MLERRSSFMDDLPDIDTETLIWGTILGFVVGGLLTLFTAPKGGTENRRQIGEMTQNVRTRVEAAIPSDPVEQSMADGKAAARRRREELTG